VEALGINGGFLIAQIVNFLLIFALVSLVWKNALRFLDKRSATIAEGLENARKAEEKLAHAQADYDAKLAEAETQARHKITEAVTRADEIAGAIRAKAEAEAQHIRERAREDAEAERNLILADMRGQVAALAMAAAHKLVGEALDEQRQRALVSEFFSKVPAEVTSVGADVLVEVTSALPLTDAEKKKAQETIGASDVTFKVDPSILGGLVVQAGDRVVDGSYLGQLREMGQHLQ